MILLDINNNSTTSLHRSTRRSYRADSRIYNIACFYYDPVECTSDSRFEIIACFYYEPVECTSDSRFEIIACFYYEPVDSTSDSRI